MRILITGASGLIGRRVAIDLLRRGHEVLALARTPARISFLPADNIFQWNHTEAPPAEALHRLDAIIHLAGEGVADQRWTARRKKQIADSRNIGTFNILKAIKQLAESDRPGIFIGASAIGIYGNSAEMAFSESSPRGKGFLAELCSSWESWSQQAATLGLRTVLLRTGVVLAPEAGALPKMGPFVMGSGNQWLSWVHAKDVVGFIRFALANANVEGAYNLTSPQPVRQRELAAFLRRARAYPISLRVPSWALSLALGEMAEVVTGSLKATPERTLAAGYRFEFPNLPGALENLFHGRGLLDQSFTAAQFVSRPRNGVVPFFAKAENLEELTPPWLNFRILKKSTSDLAPGTTIDYRLRIHGLPVRWRTLISDWNLPDSFADDQLKGPYRKWHHEHEFISVHGGTLLTDKVTYQVPLSWLGKALLSRWVARNVRTIFEYRKKKIQDLARAGRLG